MHQSFVSTPPPLTVKGGIMTFQSLGISPALWGQADDVTTQLAIFPILKSEASQLEISSSDVPF